MICGPFIAKRVTVEVVDSAMASFALISNVARFCLVGLKSPPERLKRLPLSQKIAKLYLFAVQKNHA